MPNLIKEEDAGDMDTNYALHRLMTILNADLKQVRQMAKHANAGDRLFNMLMLTGCISVYTVLCGIAPEFLEFCPSVGILVAVLMSRIWSGYLSMNTGTDAENLLAYLQSKGGDWDPIPIAQILDSMKQSTELEKNKKKDTVGIILSVLVVMLLAFHLNSMVEWRGSVKNGNTEDIVSSDQSAEPLPPYVIENGQVTIYSWIGEPVDGKLVVPSEVEGYPVTAIGKLAFAERQDITHVEVPEGIVKIDSGAFKNCGKLQQISLPQSLRELGAEVFQNCNSLLSCTIPNGVIEIRSRAFSSCKALRQVYLPKALSKIGEYAFSGCSALEEIRMPERMPDGKISQYAFEQCKKLSSIRIPEGVNKISARAFYNCTNLSEVELPATVESIGSSAFRSCSNLNEIWIPAGCSVDSCSFKESPTVIHRK